MSKIKRDLFSVLYKRLNSQNGNLIQALLGPRQVGKTTLALQLQAELPMPSFYESADGVAGKDQHWPVALWERAKIELQGRPGLIIIDEIQKVENWSESLKKVWDEQNRKRDSQIRILVLGSSRLLLHRGLSESLMGRFEVSLLPHWSFSEMKKVYPDLTCDEFILHGGYPGPYEFYSDRHRFFSYIQNSIIEPSISKDILLFHPVEKTKLLRNTFELACHYSGKILSYNKLLGQLQDAGNTTTISHYTELLDEIVMLKGLQKYSGQEVRQRASSPKFQVYNNALLSSQWNKSFEEIQSEPKLYGQLFESAVGAHLLNIALMQGDSLYYWREGNAEVDFVFETRSETFAIEVKSSERIRKMHGLKKFLKSYPKAKPLLIGAGGMDQETFFSLSSL